jgi:transposase
MILSNLNVSFKFERIIEMGKTQLTPGQRTTIVVLYEQRPGISYSEIAGIVQCSVAQVKYWVKMYRSRDIFDHIASGRPPVIDETFNDDILIETVAEPTLSSHVLANRIGISEESVRSIRHEVGFVFGKPFICPPLTNGHKLARIAFAQQLLSNGTDLSRIVFTDEATVLIDPSRKKLWRTAGWRTEMTTVDQICHPIKRMIWAGIGINWKSPIIYIDGNVNSQSYISQLLNYEVFTNLNEHYGSNFFLQQDGALPHTSRYTIEWLQAMNIKILENWPPHSPDLSPIEHCWDIVKDRINMRTIKNLEDLDKAIQEAWNSIEMSIINNLVSSFESRLRVCLENNGSSLNGHWNRVHEIHHSDEI